MFSVGQKVFTKHCCDKCLGIYKAQQRGPDRRAPDLEENVVYTIRAVAEHPVCCGTVWIEEAHGTMMNGREIGYISCGFRPVSEKYIENFEKMKQPYDPAKDPDLIKEPVKAD